MSKSALVLQGIHVKHMFAEPVEVSVSSRIGGVGAHTFFVLEFIRTGRHGRHMLVSDKRGRVNHCTHELAAMLGHTPFTLRAAGALSIRAPYPAPVPCYIIPFSLLLQFLAF